MELNGKVAIITGGTGGIGRAMARAFLAEGASAVVISDLDAAQVKTTAAEIGCDGMAADVTDEEQVRALVDFALNKYGQ
jgi:D-sorbitol dehydrogenase (acceptor)